MISCDYKQTRPFRIITASEDTRTIFYQGPPFKMHHSNNDQHTNFINCVRFSPDGSKIASCSSDKKVRLVSCIVQRLLPSACALSYSALCFLLASSSQFAICFGSVLSR